MRTTKFFFTVCIIMLSALFVNGMYFFFKQEDSNHKVSPVPISEYMAQNTDKPENNHIESSSSEENPINLLVMGLDNDGTRCDVIMLFNYDPGSSCMNIMSIARDTRVSKDGRYCKINALYSKGEEKAVAREVTNITGLPVHYYITIDFKGFREIIDTLDGVEFYVPFRMSYDDPTQNLHIHLKKGMQLLNGDKAEQLVRYRKGNTKGQGYMEGDIGRIKIQQDFLKALLLQKINIRYISRMDELFQVMRKYSKTNINLSDITQYMESVRKISSDRIKTFSLPGESRRIGNVWYFIYDKSIKNEIINKNFYK